MTVVPATLGRPAADEVLIRIVGVGLCHTDLAARDGAIPIALPAVLGHEAAGVVEATGDAVSGFAIGDGVIASFARCGRCGPCAAGLPGYCRDFVPLNFGCARPDGSRAIATAAGEVGSHFFGQSSFASHALVPARQLLRIVDPPVPLALLGPLGCSLMTGAGTVLRALDCAAGSALLVLGGGPVGLAAVMAARARGCGTIVLSEPVAARRTLAIELGATHAIDPLSDDADARLDAALPTGADNAIDTTGLPPAIEAAMARLAVFGTMALLASPTDPAGRLSFEVMGFVLAGRRIRGIIEGDVDPNAFIPELLALYREGRFPFDRLIDTFPLDRIDDAIAAQARGACVKAVLIP